MSIIILVPGRKALPDFVKAAKAVLPLYDSALTAAVTSDVPNAELGDLVRQSQRVHTLLENYEGSIDEKTASDLSTVFTSLYSTISRFEPEAYVQDKRIQKLNNAVVNAYGLS